MKLRKLSAIILTTAVLFGATSAFGDEIKTKLTLTVAHAATTDEAYVLTVPADLSLSGSGWNSVGNINVAHDSTKTTTTFDTSKKVVVTAASQNGGLKKTDGDNLITYTIKAAKDDTEATTSFTFTAAEINASGGTDKAIGVDVADYSTAPNGTYEDYITYTATVESAATTVTVTWNASDITGNTSFTKDGVTITAGMIDSYEKSFLGNGTFTTTLGNFTKIEVSAGMTPSGTGWSGGTWTGTASNSVAFSVGIAEISTIVFTIEQ